jgi:predicted DNA-binding transcriptional regulator YafY
VPTATSGRLLDLLGLLQMPRPWSGAELAGRLGVTTRTVRNDVARLRMLGYRIDGFRGASGGYRLAPGAKIPPLLLDDGDVIAITAGLLSIHTGGIAGMEDNAQRALAKLEQVMPPALRRRAAALRSAVVQIPADTPPPPIAPEVLSVISAACRDHEVLRFDYVTHTGETTERRLVEPHRLVSWGRRWYLVAYDRSRADWRTFRVDRMVPNPPSGPRFTPRRPPAGDLAAYVSRGASAAAWRYQATVTVFAPAAAFADMPPAAGLVEPVDEDTCTFTTGADDLVTLATQLGRLDRDFHVDDPPELVATIRELAGRYGRATGGRPERQSSSAAGFVSASRGRGRRRGARSR